MNLEQIEALQGALDPYDRIEARRQAFIDVNSTGGTPRCGWREWDETLADFNEEISGTVDELAAAIRKALA